ncbi:hypothetical protein HER32_13955 [Hymenobacter sp. BT18]|uniref:hypothetical protein n=1 Tax=Hymenobacter sp. BT18 TaxID=2835648 RepID=UPI00143E4DDA|nr:hypothetical protein [Hymenobacter sp. BT18]QIX62223.1 hypothetical protein HER32_13955 [Hymenobacter sp. BT18]
MLSLLLLGLVLEGHPQALTPTLPSAYPTEPRPTRADTAQAVHELFKSRRTGGLVWPLVGTVGMLAAILPAQQSTSAGVWTPGVIGGAALVGVGIGKSVRFKRKNETAVLRELAQTGHLPAYVSRRLRGRYRPIPGMAKEENPLPAPGTGPDSLRRSADPLTPGPVAASARQDTLDAITALFMMKRVNGEWPLALALPGLRLMSGGTREYNPVTGSWEETPASGGAVAAGLGLAGVGLTYMLVRHTTYSYEKLNALHAACAAGAPIPAQYRAQLQPRHFAKAGKWKARLARREARRRG